MDSNVMLIVALFLGWLFVKFKEIREQVGQNSLMDIAMKMKEKLANAPTRDYRAILKETLSGLSKNQFDKFKLFGTYAKKKNPAEVSRGYMKLKDILTRTRLKPSGEILSLACGRGGWEQYLCRNAVGIHGNSITLGPNLGNEGHEGVSDKPWPGKENINFWYADITRIWERGYKMLLKGIPYPSAGTFSCDWLFFDGGESKKSAEEEANKFYDLFERGVMPAFRNCPPKVGFVLKILTPDDPRLMRCMKEIQSITGKGDLVRCSYSRNSNVEQYFVSTPVRAVEPTVRALINDQADRATLVTRPSRPVHDKQDASVRSPLGIVPGLEILEELDMRRSIDELGAPIDAPERNFAQWEVMAIYPFGTQGSAANYKPDTAVQLTRPLGRVVPGLNQWETTNTTPDGFMRVFMAKIDTSPCEQSEYHPQLMAIYDGMADYFRTVYEHEEMTFDEVREQCNKQGAATNMDNVRNVGEYIEQKGWEQKVERHINDLLEGKPSHGIFMTMGKREKKVNGLTKGSRMVSYLPIGMRLAEAKLMGNLLKLTKPNINKYGVGGLGLHDLGMRVKEVWKGYACADDIAGWDTRIGVIMQSMECRFICALTKSKNLRKKIRAMYRLYAYPHMLIPRHTDRFVRSELVRGRGSVMSGRIVTYSMNTISRIAVSLLQQAVADKVEIKDLREYARMEMSGLTLDGKPSRWGGCTSGDDSFRTSDRKSVKAFSHTGGVLNNLGLIRKNIPYDAPTPFVERIEDVEFCSHNYERVTYYDEYTLRTVERFMPTRTVGEIVGKAQIRLGGTKDDLADWGWMSAQGNNLMVNYHHIRDVRRLAFAYKSVVPPDVVLVEDGGKLFGTPWMREGDLLDVVNCCLFGDSTHYPEPLFCVRRYSHLGYLSINRESRYNANYQHKTMIHWRKEILVVVKRLASQNGGDYSFMGEMTRYSDSV
uniref:NS5-like protein n=1 Tax=Soybean thrips virus 1 TaxID=2796560 RepID=A0A7T3R0M3_9VIRU|nr:NS5-like protein [Soybean thrips virus 1]